MVFDTFGRFGETLGKNDVKVVMYEVNKAP